MKIELSIDDELLDKIIIEEMDKILSDSGEYPLLDDRLYYRTLMFAAEVIKGHYTVRN